jgi:hypothetical protein
MLRLGPVSISQMFDERLRASRLPYSCWSRRWRWPDPVGAGSAWRRWGQADIAASD